MFQSLYKFVKNKILNMMNRFFYHFILKILASLALDFATKYEGNFSWQLVVLDSEWTDFPSQRLEKFVVL